MQGTAGGGGLEVSRGALRQAGRQVTDVSRGVAALGRGVPGACAPAAGHGGWRFAAALESCGSRWEGQFAARARELASAGSKLDRCAAAYDQLEKDLTAQINAAVPGRP